MSLSNSPTPVKQNGSPSLNKPSGFLTSALVTLFFSLNNLQAAEISAFEVIDSSGSLSLKFISDNQKISTLGTTTQNNERQLWQEELNLKMNGYIYHPNFLKMDLSAGLLSDQTKFDFSGYKYSTNQQVNNLSARLDFLYKRPTPFSVYYNKTNTIVPTGSTGSFLQENIIYGSEVALLSPLSPVTVRLSNFRETTYGEGSNQRSDEMNEQFKLSMNYPYGVGDYVQLSLLDNHRISRSGSLALPIVETESDASSTGFKTKNTFGSDNQLQLTSHYGQQEQKGFPEKESWFFRPKLDWTHNKKFISYYTFSTNHIKEQDREIKNDRTTAKLKYSGENSLGGVAGLSLSSSESTGFEFEDKGINLSTSKKIDTNHGKYDVSYSASLNSRDQTSTLLQIPVFGDQYTLNGITQETITQSNIDTTTIIVSNSTRSQTFVEGLDYSITVIGNQTLIERLIGGNIADGQSVLIDYSYDTGGTMKYERQTQNININLALNKFYNIFTRFYQSKQNLIEGNPTINLNSSDGTILGLRINRPLKKGMTVGGELLTQRHNDDSNPYDKQNIDAFINLPLFSNAMLKLNTGILMIDNEQSDEDINKKTLGLNFRSRPWLRTSMTFESQYSHDTGGSTKRTTLNNTLNFSWRYRQLNLKTTIKHKSEEQGIVERDDWSIYLKLQRAF